MHIPISEIQVKYPRIDELPFDSERKMMSTLHTFFQTEHTSDSKEKQLLVVKGAVDVLLQRPLQVSLFRLPRFISERDETVTSANGEQQIYMHQ